MTGEGGGGGGQGVTQMSHFFEIARGEILVKYGIRSSVMQADFHGSLTRLASFLQQIKVWYMRSNGLLFSFILDFTKTECFL